MATGGGISGLLALFSEIDSLEVPEFQRNYSWGDSQIEAFHSDLMYATRHDVDHFLGSTILMSDPSNPFSRTYQVIDGQQRLTTIFLYLAILRDKLLSLPSKSLTSESGGVSVDVLGKYTNLIFSSPENGEARFKSNDKLRTFMQTHIFPEPSKSRPKVPRQHKYYTLDLRKAYFKIQILIDSEVVHLNDQDQLQLFYNLSKTFERRLQILRVVTTTYAESFDIFMTLNSRGMPLGPSDLVKSLFMKHVAAGLEGDKVPVHTDYVASIWNELTDNIGDGDVNQFLRHFLVARQPKSVIAKVIYSTVESLVAPSLGDSAQLSKNLLNEMNAKSAIYSKLLRPETIEDAVIQQSCKTMHQLSDSYRIFMMTVLVEENEISLIERRELSRMCENLVIRWVLIGGNAQELEDYFQTLCQMIKTQGNSIDMVREAIKFKVPVDSETLKMFNMNITKTGLIRTVLYRINTLVGDSSELIVLDPNKMHVEHIAPATMTAHWRKVLFPEAVGDVSAEYAARVERWGNKTLLDKKINESIGQSPFSDKCNGIETGNWGGYRDSPISITRELTREEAWNYENIKLRSRWIGECFVKIWGDVDNSKQVVPFHDWKAANPAPELIDNSSEEIY